MKRLIYSTINIFFPAAVSHLPKCREKLGLNFPPLDLGTTTSLLNISISDYNLDCWNGSDIGSYIVDKTISSKSTAVSYFSFIAFL